MLAVVNLSSSEEHIHNSRASEYTRSDGSFFGRHHNQDGWDKSKGPLLVSKSHFWRLRAYNTNCKAEGLWHPWPDLGWCMHMGSAWVRGKWCQDWQVVVALWFWFGVSSCTEKCVLLLERNAGKNQMTCQGSSSKARWSKVWWLLQFQLRKLEYKSGFRINIWSCIFYTQSRSQRESLQFS